MKKKETASKNGKSKSEANYSSSLGRRGMVRKKKKIR